MSVLTSSAANLLSLPPHPKTRSAGELAGLAGEWESGIWGADCPWLMAILEQNSLPSLGLLCSLHHSDGKRSH